MQSALEKIENAIDATLHPEAAADLRPHAATLLTQARLAGAGKRVLAQQAGMLLLRDRLHPHFDGDALERLAARIMEVVAS